MKKCIHLDLKGHIEDYSQIHSIKMLRKCYRSIIAHKILWYYFLRDFLDMKSHTIFLVTIWINLLDYCITLHIDWCHFGHTKVVNLDRYWHRFEWWDLHSKDHCKKTHNYCLKYSRISLQHNLKYKFYYRYFCVKILCYCWYMRESKALSRDQNNIHLDKYQHMFLHSYQQMTHYKYSHKVDLKTKHTYWKDSLKESHKILIDHYQSIH